MKNLKSPEIEKYRSYHPSILELFGSFGDETYGVFYVPSCTDGFHLKIMVTVGAGWDHVSVSRPTRCPNWPEMEQVKRLFFKPEETAMQLHVPPSDHINHHPYCLHLWRPLNVEIPRPPNELVGAPK